jgi:hypothetical protein
VDEQPTYSSASASPGEPGESADGSSGQVQVQVHNRVTDKMGNRHRAVAHRAVKPAARADHPLPQREAPWWPQEPKALGRVPRVD